ncbi:hypothetical protein EMCRGX_G002419 [Ephydatia muelleri]
MANKRSLEVDASKFGSPTKCPTVNDKPSAAAQTLASTIVDAGFQETSHSTVASGSLLVYAQGGEKATQKRREQARQKPIQNGYVNSEDLAVVRTFDPPTEVLEMILCQVNIRHLYFSCRLVCKRWNDVVRREKFIQWKKTYYRHKSSSDCLHNIGGGWCGCTCVMDMAKSVQEHATVAFKGLKNVECRPVTHWLTVWGKCLQWPLERNKRGEPKKEDLFLFSKYVLQTLESFLASEDQEIDLDHLPICSSSDIRSPVEKYQQAVSAVLGAEVVDWKPLYWTCYINVALFWRDVVCHHQHPAEPELSQSDGGGPTPTDVQFQGCLQRLHQCSGYQNVLPVRGYLKLYQLQKPTLNYGCLLVDESQDLGLLARGRHKSVLWS